MAGVSGPHFLALSYRPGWDWGEASRSLGHTTSGRVPGSLVHLQGLFGAVRWEAGQRLGVEGETPYQPEHNRETGIKLVGFYKRELD